MDAHFSKILPPSGVNTETPSITFIAAPCFGGRKDGFKFQKGSRGLGYYYDRVQVNERKEREEAAALEAETAKSNALHDKKRKRIEDGEQGSEQEDVIDQMLEEADQAVVQLDQSRFTCDTMMQFDNLQN